MKVDVYRNLHKGMYSVRHDGKVVAHAESVVILNPKFRVSQSGRDRVRRERRKNVHAMVTGELIGFNETPITTTHRGSIRYDPYENDTFMLDGEPIQQATGTAILRKDFTIHLVSQ